jgi:hypothetical protein
MIHIPGSVGYGLTLARKMFGLFLPDLASSFSQRFSSENQKSSSLKTALKDVAESRSKISPR